MADQKTEDSFRKALEDVADVAAALAPHCETVQELIDLARLGVQHPAQLRLVLAAVASSKKGR